MATSLPLPITSSPPKTPPKNPQNPTHTEAHQLLQSCTSLSQLKQVHAHLIRTGLSSSPLTAGHLVAAIASSPFSSPDYASLVFSQIPHPSTPFASNSIIRAYANHGAHSKALLLYLRLLEAGRLPDRFTLPSLFKSCRPPAADPRLALQLHAHAFKLGFASDPFVLNTLINAYSAFGNLAAARKVFDRMPHPTVVSWATLIAAYSNSDDPAEALAVYRAMLREKTVEPNEITLVNVLTACARARDLEMAKRVHRYIEEKRIGFNLVLWAALLDVYCKCGRVGIARKLFDEMPERNLFCWNIMIKGHVEASEYKEAMYLFQEMQAKGVVGDKITMASLVLACAHLGALDLGKWLHFYIKRESIEVDVVLGTALVDMYGKCGCMDSAMAVFDEMPERDVMTWTALIGALAMCGHGEKAIEIFDKMERSGVKPDAVTFVGLLTACSHAGLVDNGRFYFDSMRSVYNIEPTVEHYGCMVDLLGRAGFLDEAEDLIRRMPMAPDYFVLGSLLGACRIHKNLEVAKRTASRLLQLDSKNGGTYVLLSNIYSSMEDWDEADRVRKLMAEKNIRKPPGCSMIETGGEMHEFVMGDESHPRSAEIYAMVDDMMSRLKAVGHVPNKSQVLLDVDEEEKESALCRHSEKLAIAFGLISTSPGMPIRVMKNLRVCSDCHAATKLISKIYGREIVVRDRYRFHHFKDGSCSCKDFW